MIVEAYTRVFVEAERLEETLAFYRVALDGEETLRFDFPAAGLTLAAVSSKVFSVLIIAGTAEARRPFEATRVTLKVASLTDEAARLRSIGAVQLEPVREVPTGKRTRFRFPDGLVVEYVEHG